MPHIVSYPYPFKWWHFSLLFIFLEYVLCANTADPDLMPRSRCALFALNIYHKKNATGHSSIAQSPKTRFPIIEKLKFFVISGDRKRRCKCFGFVLVVCLFACLFVVVLCVCVFFFFFCFFFFFFFFGGGGVKMRYPSFILVKML